jgi:glycosyltransferase involved in cell wall biosynthesis
MQEGSPHILIAAYAFPHHSAHSGYHRIAEHVTARRLEIPPRVRSLIGKFTPGIVRSMMVRITGLHGYFPECYWLEREIRRTADPGARTILHFLYPENSYYFSRNLPESSHRLVATYHQPPEEARRFIVKKDPLKRLDSVILLSESQREFFEPIVGADRITIVPHGVETEFFSPAASPAGEKRIVAVGSWLRDFVTLADTMRILEKTDPDIICDIVAATRVRELLGSRKNVRFHAGITDGALVDLYRNASIAIFPLNGAAANNALLEAMSCGLPVIATDLPAIREYAPDDCALRVPRDDPERFADAIRGLFDDGRRRADMGNASRRRAESYSWTRIGRMMTDVYERIGNNWKGGS